MLVLGIDTTCDDTSVGLVESGTRIMSNIIASQHDFHVRYGGIVPSVASRQHVKIINRLLTIAFEEAGVKYTDIDGVAVSSDQGLAPSLAVGVAVAKTFALVSGKPLIGIHHVEGHCYSPVLAFNQQLRYPFICLTVAGGHTMLLLVKAFGVYELLGHCRDDSAGEAYDKIARRLGLGYPGGPILDKLAAKGNPVAYDFPRPLMNSGDLDFSFSGLKSAVNRLVDQLESSGSAIPVEDIAASFQSAVMDVLIHKTVQSIGITGIRTVAIAGGVAANGELRRRLRQLAIDEALQVFIPPVDLCIDNGAMIAGAGYFHLAAGKHSSSSLDYRANAPLGELEVKYRHLSKYA